MTVSETIENLDFSKGDSGLLPAVIQDHSTRQILMVGYMNREALDRTLSLGKVTFFSRSKQRLWTKGEESGNFLDVVSCQADCDRDTLLLRVTPHGPVCHTGTDTCWGEENQQTGFLNKLEEIIADRRSGNADQSSYVASLFEGGINKIAQKVGEEAIETILEAKDNDDRLFLNESADLLFHYMILLQQKGFRLADVESVLAARHAAR